MIREEPGSSGASRTGARVLLIEDDPDFAFLTSENLRDAHHSVVATSSMHEALTTIARQDDFDVVLLDLGLPDIDGLGSIRAAVDDGRLPIVVFTGDARESTRDDAVKLGAVEYLVKGEVTPERLDEVIRSVVEQARQAGPRPMPGTAPFSGPQEAITSSFDVLAAVTGLPRWAYIRIVGSTDIVLVRTGGGDELGPGAQVELAPALLTGSGPRPSVTHHVELLAAGERPFAPPAAVHQVVSADRERVGVVVGWSPEPIEPSLVTGPAVLHAARQIVTDHDLEVRRSRAIRRADIAGNAAAVDPLTGLGNRRAYDQFLRSEENRAERLGYQGVVFSLDLDELKVINDTMGHAAGDRYIRSAATGLMAATRAGDTVFRVGGDEFTVVASGCTVEEAPTVEQRMRDCLREQGVEASIGWAPRLETAGGLVDAAHLADARMYEEKAARRRSRPESSSR